MNFLVSHNLFHPYKVQCSIAPQTLLYRSNQMSAVRPQKRLGVNVNYLDDGIISAQHAWLWGWLVTDGCITYNKQCGYYDKLYWHLRYDCFNVCLRSNLRLNRHTLCRLGRRNIHIMDQPIILLTFAHFRYALNI